ENAAAKTIDAPWALKAKDELLPLVRDSIVKAQNARNLEERRSEEEKKRMAEAEAASHERRPRTRDGRESDQLQANLDEEKSRLRLIEEERAREDMRPAKPVEVPAIVKTPTPSTPPYPRPTWATLRPSPRGGGGGGRDNEDPEMTEKLIELSVADPTPATP